MRRYLDTLNGAYVGKGVLARTDVFMRIGMHAALLPDRGVVKVSGDDARKFLNGLATCDMARVTPAAARFAALLTPHGHDRIRALLRRSAAAGAGEPRRAAAACRRGGRRRSRRDPRRGRRL